jgi:hypothetical protein
MRVDAEISRAIIVPAAAALQGGRGGKAAQAMSADHFRKEAVTW